MGRLRSSFDGNGEIYWFPCPSTSFETVRCESRYSDHPRDETFTRRAGRGPHRTGLESSIVLCEASEEAIKELKNPTQGQILRAMTADDSLDRSRFLAQQREEFFKLPRL